MALYIALKATFVIMVLMSLTFVFIGHWDRGKVFLSVTLTDKQFDYRQFAGTRSKLYNDPVYQLGLQMKTPRPCLNAHRKSFRHIRTMTTKVVFKAMYKAIGFSDNAATKLNNTAFVDSTSKLSNITSALASKICKTIRSPGGAGVGGHVIEGADHNLVIAAAVALNASCVLRTIEYTEIRLDPSDLFDLHEGQQLLEGRWVNKERADAFRPLSENDQKQGWKVLREDLHDHTKNVRGAVTKAPVA